jgi:hypothetical protein
VTNTNRQSRIDNQQRFNNLKSGITNAAITSRVDDGIPQQVPADARD